MKYRYIVHMRQSKDIVFVEADQTPTYVFESGAMKNMVYIGYAPERFRAAVADVEYIEGGECQVAEKEVLKVPFVTGTIPISPTSATKEISF